jgi:hypothetical protein
MECKDCAELKKRVEDLEKEVARLSHRMFLHDPIGPGLMPDNLEGVQWRDVFQGEVIDPETILGVIEEADV